MLNDSYATAARPDQKPFIWKDRIYRLLSHYGRCQNNWVIRIINSCTHFAIFYHLIPLDSLKMHCAGNINMKRFYMIWHICTVYVYCTPSRLKYTWCISDIISCQYIIITLHYHNYGVLFHTTEVYITRITNDIVTKLPH